MYIVIDKTENKSFNVYGSYPYNELKDLVENNHDIEVISTYSNSFKYNYRIEFNSTNFENELKNDEIKIDFYFIT